MSLESAQLAAHGLRRREILRRDGDYSGRAGSEKARRAAGGGPENSTAALHVYRRARRGDGWSYTQVVQEVSVKLSTTLFVALLATLVLVTGLTSLGAAQTTGPKNPDLVPTSLAGQDLFQLYCSSCHGRDGKGGGHAAPALKVPPADLTTIAQRNMGAFPADSVTASITGKKRLSTPAHGSSDMPVWGPIFKGLDTRDAINAARIESVVKYIESIQAKAKA